MYSAILKDVRDLIPDLKSSQKKVRLAAWKKIQTRCIAEYNKDVSRFHDKEKAKEEYLTNIQKLANLYPASKAADKAEAHIP